MSSFFPCNWLQEIVNLCGATILVSWRWWERQQPPSSIGRFFGRVDKSLMCDSNLFSKDTMYW